MRRRNEDAQDVARAFVNLLPGDGLLNATIYRRLLTDHLELLVNDVVRRALNRARRERKPR